MTDDSPVPYTPAPFTPTPARLRSLNTGLLERVRQLILMRPELHDQSTWGQTPDGMPSAKITALAEAGSPCGTTACVAGWAALFATSEDAYLRDSMIHTPAKSHQISTYAGYHLGLTWLQQIWLFAGDASRDRVLWTLKWLPDHPDSTNTDLAWAWYQEQRSSLESS